MIGLSDKKKFRARRADDEGEGKDEDESLKEPDGFRWEVGDVVRGRKIKRWGVSASSCPPKIAPAVSTLRD